MKRFKSKWITTSLVFIMVLLVGILPLAAVAAPVKTPSLIVDGIPMAPRSPLLWDNGTILISIEDFATHTGANFQWNEPGETTWIQKYGNTVLFKISSKEILKNGLPVEAPILGRFVGKVFYVPLRFVAEKLGLTVNWNNEVFQVEILTGERHMPVERVESAAFNAVVAYTDKGNLWILDGRVPDALPRQITDTGYAELVGLSQDGKWLAYKYTAKTQGENAFLWVASVDGKGIRPVDTQPIYDEPVWSPTDNKLAYTVLETSTEGFIPTGTIKYADITDEEIKVNTLIGKSPTLISSLAWYPDGKSITVSLPRTEKHPPTLEQAFLDGKGKTLYMMKDEEIIDEDGLYIWAFIGLKWSPNGKYLAYHVRMNSASLTADVVGTNILDAETNQIIKLNEGLKYPQWFAFSPNNERLAYIAGTGRDVISNKQLELVDLEDSTINDYNQRNYVDVQPVWLPDLNELLFCRGLESKIFADSDIFPGVMVPGQRIYKLKANGSVDAITKDSSDTADYYPIPSPKGDYMLFLRLERFNQGSLYLQPINASDKAVEILRGIRGNPGYYGNYYPEWISVHWF